MVQTLQSTWLDRRAELERPAEPEELIELLVALAARPRLWRPLVRHDPRRRWYERLLLTDAAEVWLIGWAPGQSTSVHDHGGAAGALTAVEGALSEEEFSADLQLTRRSLHSTGSAAGFAETHIHRVSNLSARNATSIHAYSPPGREMREHPRRREAQIP
jgi:predicted metal-dependent enzyme (double-stranded beta helix superfamily)